MNTSTPQSKIVASRGKFFVAALAAAVIGISSAFAGQADDQIAVQLGAIQQGLDLSNNPTPEQVASALVQGRSQLKLKAKTSSSVGTSAFQAQLLLATENALNSPVTLTAKVVPTGGTKPISFKLSPQLCTASQISSVAGKRIPNFGPTLSQTGVAAAIALVGGNPLTPVFKYTGKDATAIQTKQLKDANKLAGAFLVSALKSYKTGTANWIGVPKTGPVGGATYLPNFTAKAINGQAAAPQVLADAAAAVASNAVNGLGSLKIAANVQAMTQSLVKAAAKYQKVSAAATGTLYGTVGGATLGIIAQVAGVANNAWLAGPTFTILQGVVNGALKASKANVASIAAGLAGGFAGTWVQTAGAPGTAAAFITANAADILSSLVTANNGKAFTGKVTNAQLLVIIQNTITDAFTDRTLLVGAGGIRDFTYNNATGTPITDTVGL